MEAPGQVKVIVVIASLTRGFAVPEADTPPVIRPYSGPLQDQDEKHSLMGQPAFTAPGPSIDVKSLSASAGIVVVDDSPAVAPLQAATAGAIAAAKVAGFKATLINGGANNPPTDDTRLLEQAVNLHPAVALQVGIVSELEGSGLTYARQHGVKV